VFDKIEAGLGGLLELLAERSRRITGRGKDSRSREDRWTAGCLLATYGLHEITLVWHASLLSQVCRVSTACSLSYV